MKFIQDAIDELKRVSWLPRNQMVAQTVLVVLLVIFFSIVVGGLDFVITRLFGFII